MSEDDFDKNASLSSESEFGIPKLGEFPNFRQRTRFNTSNPLRISYRFFMNLKRRLTAKSDVIYHQEDSRILSTIFFLIIFTGILALLTYYLFR